ncbi:MAG: 3-keto-disaccharide hydrolase [Opitutales bacterium]
MMHTVRIIAVTLVLTTLLGCRTNTEHTHQEEGWIPLFNGKNLDGWTPKFSDHKLGYNLNNIFRVEDGLLKVSYDDTDEFKGDFGHLFYKTPYSHYRIRAVFRFTGEQLKGGPVWAYRNNGLMLHSQDPLTMKLDQNFPASIEVQFKGNNPEKGPKNIGRTMGALFNPGMTARVNGEMVNQAQTSSPAFEGTEWCTVEVEVRGQEEMIHYVNGVEVLRSTDFRLDNGAPVGSGFIAIQAETHPTEFKSIEILPRERPASAYPMGRNNKAPEGYRALFDGKTLDGWQLHPLSKGHWKVLDGVIDYDAQTKAQGNDRHLWTEESFRDFELHVEWRIKELHGIYNMPIILSDGSELKDENGKTVRVSRPNADSGILLRGQLKSQCNIWNWPIGSGEVYGYRRDMKQSAETRARVTPSRRADNPIGEWNKFVITMKGDRLTVNLNGETVIEDAQLAGIPAEGPIALQHHGGKNKDGSFNNASSLVQFRNIYIREL